MDSNYYYRKTALITGGSSGIGLAIAKKLAAQGACVWILARREEVLQQALEEIKAARIDPGQEMGIIQANIADRETVTSRLQQHIAQYGAPDILINGAGITHPALFTDTPFSVFDEIMQINFQGTVNVTKTVLPAMIARGSGHLAIVGSGGGFIGLIGYSAYSASKFALRGFADVLRQECRPTGVKVHYIAPSDTQTPQLEYENTFKPAITRELVGSNSKVQTADQVADSVLPQMARGRYMIIPGGDTRLYYYLTNTFGLVYPVMDLLVDQAWKKINAAKGNGRK